MAFVLTAAQIYGVEAEEVVNKRYRQIALLTVTAANTDVDWDLGDFTGTFWNAVDATSIGEQALKAFKDIQQRALSFNKVGGSLIGGYSQSDASYSSFVGFTSSAITGGAASVTATVTGLLKTDTVYSVTQQTNNANSKQIVSYELNPAAADALGIVYTADPGNSGKVSVIVQRSGETTPASGTYTIVMNSTNTNLPDILFVTGNAPTAGTLILEWVLKPQEAPVEYYSA